MQAEAAQGLVQSGIVAGKDGASVRSRFEQQRGFAKDHFQIAGLIQRKVADVRQLHNLALGDHVSRIGENLQDRHPFQRHHQLKRARVEKVAHQDAGWVAPARIGGNPSAPQVGAVDDVVVQQGGGVEELDDRGQFDVIGALIAAPRLTSSTISGRRRLPALDDVLTNLLHQRNLGGELLRDKPVHGGKIVSRQFVDGLKLGDSRSRATYCGGGRTGAMGASVSLRRRIGAGQAAACHRLYCRCNVRSMSRLSARRSAGLHRGRSSRFYPLRRLIRGSETSGRFASQLVGQGPR